MAINLNKTPTLGDILADALAAKAVVNEKPLISERAPRGLADLKKKVSDYYGDPKKFVDFTSGEPGGRRYNSVTGSYEECISFLLLSVTDATGLEKLGSGGYSDVYAIDDSRVLKIVKKADSGYARFIAQVKTHPSNPHFPKVFYSGTWGGKTVYVLERLTDQPANGTYEMKENFISAMHHTVDNPYVVFSDPHVAEAASVLEKHSLRGDLHSSNLMFRGDVPVITDPCAE